MAFASTMFFAFSCGNRDCKNANPILDKSSPDSKEYHVELLKELQSAEASTIVYTLERYEEKDEVPYLHMNIQGENLCATAVVLVLKSDKNLQKIQQNKGEGYVGSEFKNLKVKIFSDESKTVFLYEGVETIED